MDAINFIKQVRRMDQKGVRTKHILGNFDSHEDVIAEVEAWVKENPAKTRQDKFLKMFPNARKTSDGVVDIQPCAVDAANYENGAFRCGRPYTLCDKCKKGILVGRGGIIWDWILQLRLNDLFSAHIAAKL